MLAAASEDTEGASSEGEASNEHGPSSKASSSRRRHATATDWDDDAAKTLSFSEENKDFIQTLSESEEDDAPKLLVPRALSPKAKARAGQ